MHKTFEVSLTLLGSGTSTGVPVIGCTCKVCRSKDPKNHRLRASAWLRVKGTQPKKEWSILIDTATDLRTQALREKIKRVDAVLYTHPHTDHTHGIDELRSYNFMQNEPIPLFGNEWTVNDLRSRFSYIFLPGPVEGGGIPLLNLELRSAQLPVWDILGLPVTPLSLLHGSKECVGYRVGEIAYVTDCSYIPPASLDRLKGLSVLVLDCVRIKPHRTHFNLDQALDMAQKIGAKKTILTHLSHDFDYKKWVKKLPKGITLGFDGMTVKVPSQKRT